MSANVRLAVLLLAAGKGTRMKSRRTKVLHEICGRPMLAYPLAAAAQVGAEKLVVVIGRDADQVEAAFAGRAQFVIQAEQGGTGHAVQVALPKLGDFAGDVLVLYGDTPLLRAETLARMQAKRRETGAPLVILTSPEPLPGLVVRGADGRVERIVEQTDAKTPAELAIREGNTGVYLCDGAFLASAVAQLEPKNVQGELYLTDVVAIARRRGLAVEAIQLADADEALGVNTRAELARAAAVQRRRNVERWMAEGVTFIDPENVYVDTDVAIGRDTQIDPGVVITGPTRIGEGAHVKAHCVIESSVLDDDVVVGPSAHLRPGSHLKSGVRIGNFVEVKNSVLGRGVKADHLAYIGDADVGEDSSFGCGAITVNYDWVNKHRTTVGERVRIGCNANLIAPIALESDSYVAAGTTVTKPVPSDAIAVGAARQKNVEGWGKKRRKAGTGGGHSGSQHG
ncbi:MAG: bifunctional UDP-N-acetylglucosamine diphosphorylase/glucosamine-1-phosphate N-acetyltransferase GlmU [Deltaproteobacteria bacterium]|nr:bifunctional UDP-N-acetylglucosamine diphosphorylase/glucosamine-1-phosphate N-acetyltransferase GlmU [Deltaproteobacteria bacterium]